MDKQTLYNEYTETLVLGAIISNQFLYEEVEEILSENCFYDPFHKQIYRAFDTLVQQGNTPDMVAVYNQLCKEGVDVELIRYNRITGCMAHDIYFHVAHLNELGQRRQIQWLGMQLQSKAANLSCEIPEILTLLDKDLKTILDESPEQVFTFDQAREGLYQQIERNHSADNPLTGTPTGFPQLDQRSGGLQQSDLIVIAGDTSQGKTSLAISITLQAVKAGDPVAIYSMEMKKEQIAARMLAIESGIPANQLLYSPLLPGEWEQLGQGTARLTGIPLYFDDRSTSNIDTIIHSIRTLHKRHQIKGAIIDYLQILNVNMKGINKEAQMGEVARRLKNLAKELDIWVIALSQLNRDSINPVPTLARLRDSGQIAEAADLVMLIYRPEVYNRSYPKPFHNIPTTYTALIDVAKGRNIGLLKFLCCFHPQTTHFTPYREEELFEAATFDEQPF